MFLNQKQKLTLVLKGKLNQYQKLIHKCIILNLRISTKKTIVNIPGIHTCQTSIKIYWHYFLINICILKF